MTRTARRLQREGWRNRFRLLEGIRRGSRKRSLLAAPLPRPTNLRAGRSRTIRAGRCEAVVDPEEGLLLLLTGASSNSASVATNFIGGLCIRRSLRSVFLGKQQRRYR